MIFAAGETDLWVEVGKQVPSLTVLTILVVYFFKHLKDIQTTTDTRHVAEKAASEKVLTDLLERAEKNETNLSHVVETNSKVLGGITVLLTLVENDLKNGRPQ